MAELADISFDLPPQLTSRYRRIKNRHAPDLNRIAASQPTSSNWTEVGSYGFSTQNITFA